MNGDFVEVALNDRAAAANGLSASEDQVRRAVRDAHRPRRRLSMGATPVRRGRMSLATGLACLLLGGVIASAATGTIGSPLDSFFGGGDPPGRILPAGEVPYWIGGDGVPVTEVAVDDGHSLRASRENGQICFDYDGHVGECAPPSYFEEELSESPWILRGPTLRERGVMSMFGFVTSAVASVRLEYAEGPPTVAAAGNGGFIIAVVPARHPQRLVGLDSEGNEIVSQEGSFSQR